LGSVESDAELDAVLDRIKERAGASRGEDIIGPGNASRYFTVLLDGVACSYERLKDGNRQIYAFQYPGDFCDLSRHVLPNSNNEVAVAALTGCSIGIIEHRDLEQLIAQYPSLGLALWRATMLEASIFRKRLLNIGRQPALQRVAHLLCEQLARREAVGINSTTIPLTQVDLADAAGLSIVHINRTVQELRRLGILSAKGPAIEVVNRAGLVTLANFDGQYLNLPQVLSHWQIIVDGDPMARVQLAAMSSPLATCQTLQRSRLAKGAEIRGRPTAPTRPRCKESSSLPLQVSSRRSGAT
jgi:CRP-like cAMP-binding protein